MSDTLMPVHEKCVVASTRVNSVIDDQSRLFVYGSLMPGRENAHLLRGVKGKWQKGYVLADYHESGWGKTGGYPAIKLNPFGHRVNGWLLHSKQLKKHWMRLDEFEGVEYARVQIDVFLDNQKCLSAFVYTLNRSSGDII